ncbi:MAG: winged helix-turn-helix domain-containing protein [Terriglobales bacterium]
MQVKDPASADVSVAASISHDGALLRLAAWLAVGADADTKLQLAMVFQPQSAMGPVEIRALLRDLAQRAVERAASALSLALGLDSPHLMEIFLPGSKLFEVAGRNGALLRMDRLWGGPAMILMRADQHLDLLWPGPGESQLMCVRGSVWLGAKLLPTDAPLVLQEGQRLVLHAGAAVLFRRALLGNLLEAAAAAGVPIQDTDTLATPAGALKITGQYAVLHGERRRLTPAELRVLKLLMRNAGKIVTRDQLGANVERVMLRLRDKLGDGIIQTVYGSGYLLEIR